MEIDHHGIKRYTEQEWASRNAKFSEEYSVPPGDNYPYMENELRLIRKALENIVSILDPNDKYITDYSETLELLAYEMRCIKAHFDSKETTRKELIDLYWVYQYEFGQIVDLIHKS